MPFNQFKPLAIFLVAFVSYQLAIFLAPYLYQAFIEILIFGEVPNSNMIISFEAFTLGAVFTAWAIATISFATRAFRTIRAHAVPRTKPTIALRFRTALSTRRTA